jgi:DNA-binding Lrp family transcriptional regulator
VFDQAILETIESNARAQLQDIASDLGLTREALYRTTLASLERAGAIERAGARILLKRSVSAR